VDWLSGVFLGIFVFGLVFTVASFLLSGVSHLGGHDASGGGHDGSSIGHDTHVHLPTGHAAPHANGHGHEHSESKAGGFGWFSFNALIAFFTWFGGGGFLFSQLNFPAVLTIPLALVLGIIGYMLVFMFITRILLKAQTPVMRELDYDLSGTAGKVSSTIFKKGMGEVIYTKFGTRRVIAARSVDGRALPRDTEVVILRVENGVAYVDDLNKLLNEQWPDKNITEQVENPVNLSTNKEKVE
jgi:hypothetical protein